MYRYNPYMFEDTQQVAVPRRGMSRRAKLLAGLAGVGAIGAGAYATRNMKYGAGTLGRQAWNSDRVQGGITRFAKSDLGGRTIDAMQGAQSGVGIRPPAPGEKAGRVNAAINRGLARAMRYGSMGDRALRYLRNRRGQMG